MNEMLIAFHINRSNLFFSLNALKSIKTIHNN